MKHQQPRRDQCPSQKNIWVKTTSMGERACAAPLTGQQAGCEELSKDFCAKAKANYTEQVCCDESAPRPTPVSTVAVSVTF